MFMIPEQVEHKDEDRHVALIDHGKSSVLTYTHSYIVIAWRLCDMPFSWAAIGRTTVSSSFFFPFFTDGTVLRLMMVSMQFRSIMLTRIGATP